MAPPIEVHRDHVAPFHVFSQTDLSVPWTKISRRLAPQDAAEGPVPAVTTPPRLSHFDQTPPVSHLCQTALSVPRTKTSIRPGPQDTVAGRAESTPPSEDQPLHVPSAARTFSWSERSVP